MVQYALLIATIGLVLAGSFPSLGRMTETHLVGLAAAMDSLSGADDLQGPLGETLPPKTAPAAVPSSAAPAGTDPVVEAPISTVPLDTVPVDTVPVETVPIGAVPVETVPVETASARPDAPPPADAVPGVVRQAKTMFRSASGELRNGQTWLATADLAVYGRDGALIPGTAEVTLHVTKIVAGENGDLLPVKWATVIHVRNGVGSVETKNLDTGVGGREPVVAVTYELRYVSQPGMGASGHRWDEGMPAVTVAAPTIAKTPDEAEALRGPRGRGRP